MTNTLATRALTQEEVRRTLGDLTDAAVNAIIATGADIADLEMALAWENADAEGEDSGFLTGAAGAVVDILIDDAADEQP